MLIQYAVGVEAIRIVELAFGRIAQHLIRFRDSLEALLGRVIPRVDVRVKLPGQLPESALDVVQRRLSFNVEDDVEIFSTHGCSDSSIPLHVRRGASEAMRGGQGAGSFQKRISKDSVIPDHPDRALRGPPSSRGGES